MSRWIPILGLTALMVWPRLATANPIEDVLGLGARAKGLAGAATALSDDYAAVYHNPAGLGLCPHSSLSISYAHVDHSLGLDTDVSLDADLESEPIEPRDRLSLGLCMQLPLGFAFGFNLGLGLQRPMSLSHQSLDARPRFIMHDKRLDGLSIMVGLGFAIPWVDGLSIGVATSVLANSTLTLENVIPVVTENDPEVRNDINWDLSPTAAIYVGIFWRIIDEVSIGGVYRSPLYHQMEIAADTRVVMAGVTFDLDLIMQGAMWYSPQQFALGGTYSPVSGLTIVADLTWYNWAAYPGPFVVAAAAVDSAVARTLTYPPREEMGFADTWVPRAGVEYVYDEMIAGRIGYSFRPTPAGVPEARANLLDSDTHVLSFGAGFHWSPGPTADDEEGDWQFPIDIAGVRADAYFVVGILSNRTVSNAAEDQPIAELSFGGTFIDAGLTLSLEY